LPSFFKKAEPGSRLTGQDFAYILAFGGFRLRREGEAILALLTSGGRRFIMDD
jgi:hypothetical protein